MSSHLGGPTVQTFGGVDEAGRGCMVGPLVVSGVTLDRDGMKLLKEVGVRDSKKLSTSRRESLYGEVHRIAIRVTSVQIPPSEIDVYVRSNRKYRKLNYLEAKYFAKVIDRLDTKEVVVDASDTSPRRFADNIRAHLKSACGVSAFHKADRNYIAVSAASIIAKVERDAAVEKLREDYGDFGSGYPSDPKTRSYFSSRLGLRNDVDDFVRRSWKTWDNLEQAVLTA